MEKYKYVWTNENIKRIRKRREIKWDPFDKRYSSSSSSSSSLSYHNYYYDY
jgi:hypothetical protein